MKKRILKTKSGRKISIDVNSGQRKAIRKNNILPPRFTAKMDAPLGRGIIGEIPKNNIAYSAINLRGDSSTIILDRRLRKKFISVGIIGEPVGLGVRKKDRQFEKNPTDFTISPYDLMYANEIGMIDPELKSRFAIRKEIEKWGIQHDPAFFNKYSAYRKLKENGFIIMSGLQYGVDFMAYELTPDEFISKEAKKHSRYMIDVMDEPTMRLSNIIKGLEEAKEISKEYILIQAGNTSLNKRYLDRPTKKVIFYEIDGSALLIDRKYDLDAVIMRRLKHSRSYKTFPVEIRETWEEVEEDE